MIRRGESKGRTERGKGRSNPNYPCVLWNNGNSLSYSAPPPKLLSAATPYANMSRSWLFCRRMLIFQTAVAGKITSFVIVTNNGLAILVNLPFLVHHIL